VEAKDRTFRPPLTMRENLHLTRLGWPGAVTDVKIFKNSHLWMHCCDYFKNGDTFLLTKVIFILLVLLLEPHLLRGYCSTPYTLRLLMRRNLVRHQMRILGNG